MLPLLTWLVQGAVGPALVGLPVTWTATDLAAAARQWFRRLRRSDGLSRIVRAAAGDLDLSNAEFAAVRRLLEREDTWVQVGHRTVEDLAELIAVCLPDRAGESTLAAGRAIAGGLLEFAVRDLEPEWFRQVLFARLERLQADQASALDEAMLSVHAGLAALLSIQDAAEEDRFSLVMGQLEQVLGRLPPGPADRGELEVYLATLVSWLNIDPWPQDARFIGPVLTPAAIERKLRITSGRGRAAEELDADDLASRCARLVVLGGPGSGKTWLARRTARLCAEAALDALAEGALPDEVELPLYATCARLSAAPSGDDIRRAIVSSALGQLPDLGGSGITDAVRVLFEKRNAPTLLVADSLDEASGADDRIRLTDTLPPSWRIMLTSRPASWNHQLAMGDNDPSRRVGVLQQLRYPDDVEAFIEAWFSGQPTWAAGLAAQLRNRPALQQAATVPLILAFYCIVGGDQPLPERRADLYSKVIRRMLTGRWRGSGDYDPDPDACLETLRFWAWSAAASDPVSGVGVWIDEFPAPRVRQSHDDRAALDHIAPPLGPPDADTGMTRRRFVHRSLREYLTAEYVALRMPAEEAAAELLTHLWYDTDWEYAAPAALAMHCQRDQVLEEMVCRAMGGDQLPADLSAIDSCWEIRRFLARAAQESSESDWLAEAAQMIGQARLDLVTPHLGNLSTVVADGWPTSTSLITEALLGQLARATALWVARGLTGAVSRLDPTAEDRVRQTLLERLAHTADPSTAQWLAEAVGELDPTAEVRARAREALFERLAHTNDPNTVGRVVKTVTSLAVTVEDRTQSRQALLGLLAHATNFSGASKLAEAIGELNPTVEDMAQARKILIGRLSHTTHPREALGLVKTVGSMEPTAEDRARAREALLGELGHAPNSSITRELVEAVTRLGATAEDRALAQEALLGELARTTYYHREPLELAEAINRLGTTAKDRAQALETLLGRLAHETDSSISWGLGEGLIPLAVTAEDRAQVQKAVLGLLTRTTDPLIAQRLAKVLSRLDPDAEDRARARRALLEFLDPRTRSSTIRLLGEAVTPLALTAEDRAPVREVLLELLARMIDPDKALRLVEAVHQLDPIAEDLAQARKVLLGLLAKQTNRQTTRELVESLSRLDPTAEDRAEAWEVLLSRAISPQTIRELVELLPWLDPTAEDWAQVWEAFAPSIVGGLVESVGLLDPTAEDRSRAQEALLGLLAQATTSSAIGELAKDITRLMVTAEDWAWARETLLGLLARTADPWKAKKLAETVGRLDPTAEDQAQARGVLLGLLARTADPWTAQNLVESVGRLDPTVEDQARARETLLRLLARTTDPRKAQKLAEEITCLTATAGDLAQAWEALLGLLARTIDPEKAQKLAEEVTRLAVTVEDRAQARQTLLELVARTTGAHTAHGLVQAVAAMNPTVADLGGSDRWPTPPTPALLAAARRNSGLPAWLATLPLLSRTARTEPEPDDASAKARNG